MSSRSAQKRAAILEAAAVAFREHGYRGTSMDLVAEMAGVSKRTIYNHFTNKDELFAVIASELMRRATQATAVPYRADEAIESQLRTFARRKLDVSLDPDFLGLFRAVTADITRDPELAAKTQRQDRRAEEGLIKWIRKAHADGRLNAPKPELAARQFWSLLKGEAFYPSLHYGSPIPTAAQQKAAIDQTLAVFLSHYGR